MALSKISLWTRFRLLFVKSRYKFDTITNKIDGNVYVCCIIYKELDGNIYVVEEELVGE